jgi:hypothetical protein
MCKAWGGHESRACLVQDRMWLICKTGAVSAGLMAVCKSSDMQSLGNRALTALIFRSIFRNF